MRNHPTEQPLSPDNLSLVDVSDLRDPNRVLVRKLGSGDRALLRVSRRNDGGSTDIVDVPADISRTTGPWPDRWFVGLIQPNPEICVSAAAAFVTFRPRHILAAWPQPPEGWEETRDDLRTAIVEALASGFPAFRRPPGTIFATLQEMLDDQDAVLAEIDELLKREVE